MRIRHGLFSRCGRKRSLSKLSSRAAVLTVSPNVVYFIRSALPKLPDCAGVALGIDRLLMALMGTDRIADVLAFPFDRA